jgi:MerR family transcriptional regulator, repressor of the yfmOP operon
MSIDIGAELGADSDAGRRLRIGEVADLVGVTARTIRYYEELGLLDDSGALGDRAKGSHRLFSAADVARLQELVRLRDLLGLTLDELRELAEAAEVRRCLREQYHASTGDEERAQILRKAIPYVQRQLELVEARQQSLTEFGAELEAKLARMSELLTGLDDHTDAVVDSGTATAPRP